MRTDELVGSEGERCEVRFDVDGCIYTSEGVIAKVSQGGISAEVHFKGDVEMLHGRVMAAVPAERIILLDSEDDQDYGW